MGDAIITLKIMPESPDVDLAAIEEKVKAKVAEFKGEVGKSETEPVAFGLNALKVILVRDEAEGGTDELEAAIKEMEGVRDCEAVDVRRALG